MRPVVTVPLLLLVIRSELAILVLIVLIVRWWRGFSFPLLS
jgi:hypothetical protein